MSRPADEILPVVPGLTAGDAIAAISVLFSESDLVFGHGALEARDEAGWLVFAVAGLDHERADDDVSRVLNESTILRIRELASQRVSSRKPLAYLLNEAWFAGLRFYVDESVLVPRSPLAELIQGGFEPWLADADIRTALDIGTGSGCIAIALASYYPYSDVHAGDISEAALAVARRNVREHELEQRITLFRSDVFDGLGDTRYDLIISNPPYVDGPAMRALPAEYLHEPELGLAAGEDGLSVVSKMLAQATQFLSDRGILVVEVGDSDEALARNFPKLAFTWLEMSDGVSGIFLVSRDDLLAAGLAPPQ